MKATQKWGKDEKKLEDEKMINKHLAKAIEFKDKEIAAKNSIINQVGEDKKNLIKQME